MSDDTRERPKIVGRMHRISVQVHTDELDQLDQEADRRNRSRSEIVRLALRKYLGIED